MHTSAHSWTENDSQNNVCKGFFYFNYCNWVFSKSDPVLKRSFCSSSNTTLILPKFILESISHGHLVVYTCWHCKSTKGIPAPPVRSLSLLESYVHSPRATIQYIFSPHSFQIIIFSLRSLFPSLNADGAPKTASLLEKSSYQDRRLQWSLILH